MSLPGYHFFSFKLKRAAKFQMQSIECSDWSSEIKCNLQSQACRGSGGWGEGVPCLWPPQSQKPTWARPLKRMLSSVAQSCPTLCDPMDCITPGFAVHHQLTELAQAHVHRVGDALQPPHPLSSPSPPAFPSIRVFSNESVLHIRWPKYWSFSFSISPSNEYFRTDFL